MGHVPRIAAKSVFQIVHFTIRRVYRRDNAATATGPYSNAERAKCPERTRQMRMSTKTLSSPWLMKKLRRLMKKHRLMRWKLKTKAGLVLPLSLLLLPPLLLLPSVFELN